MATDYYMNISYLGIDGSVISGGVDGNNLKEQQPDLFANVCRGKSGDVPVNTRVSGWFSSARANTVGHINLDVVGTLATVRKGTKCGWTFKGAVTAEPDPFDFDQKVRPGVTDDSDTGIAVVGEIQKWTSKIFLIKPYGSVKIETSGSCP